VVVRGRAVRLTPKEFDVLQYLASHLDHAVPHQKLLKTVWGADYGNEVEYLRVFVSQLRRKIEADPGNPQYIVTEPWVGYRLAVPTKQTQ
jgi:two-component system KDP operon response regulator KdpE